MGVHGQTQWVHLKYLHRQATNSLVGNDPCSQWSRYLHAFFCIIFALDSFLSVKFSQNFVDSFNKIANLTLEWCGCQSIFPELLIYFARVLLTSRLNKSNEYTFPTITTLLNIKMYYCIMEAAAGGKEYLNIEKTFLNSGFRAV